jgi:hypothetical protein
MNPQKLDKWRRWMGEDPNEEATLQKELIDLVNNQRVFNGIREIISNNPDIQQHSIFYTVFGANYADSVLMYLRRLAKRNKQGVSLIDLLEDLKQNAEMLTREWYTSEFGAESGHNRLDEINAKNVEFTFDQHFAGEIESHLDPEVVQQDIDLLDSIHEACEELVDWRIAHLERKSPSSIPTFDDLSRWIGEVRQVFWKYNLLLFSTDLQVETVLTHNWKAIFRVAWIAE